MKKRMTKPFAVLATLALSVTAFQGVVAAAEPQVKPTNPTNSTTEQKTTPEIKIDTKVTDKKEHETDKKTDEKLTKTDTKADGQTTDKKDEKKEDKVDGKTGGKPNTAPPTSVTNKPTDKKEVTKEPDFITSAVVKNGTLSVTETIKNAKHAKGDWYASVSKDTLPDWTTAPYKTSKLNRSGLVQTFTFKNVKPGRYNVFVGFVGTVDGRFGEGYFELEVEVKKSGAVKQVKKAKKQTTVKTAKASTATTTKTKSTTTKKETTKPAVKGQGGKLPKTATSYPIATVAGAAVLMAGAGLFLVARRRKQNQS
ncbi:LPXTG-motif cell wall-anchored protein [Croceifilum oryzae]|uniref:LPXTG-motif cell wall-anchored protein n=1 Tax=Croceifilum oryzae TaxID=1553429 RepID=A0AAJ1TCE0_9BACL|nr:LPXTG cell wall anchor domain-containing protein [Croceifilum oryzae]MDQ0415934.1 LPXTG-motif cell wall-anchored protein [Croceifilum oryzae]